MKASCLSRFFASLLGFAAMLLPSVVTAQPPIPLDPYLESWSFPANWYTDSGYAPIAYTNISNVAIWDAGSVFIDTTNESAAYLQYYTVEPGGLHTNLVLQNGVLTFVYAPNWASTSQGGSGPGDFASLIDIGHSTTNASYGLWALYISPDGNSLYFSAQTNGTATNFLYAPISWTSNAFHWIGLTWTSNTSALYVDGVCLTNGSGVTIWPGQSVYTNGLFIGSDDQGLHQARGQISDLESQAYLYDLYDPTTFTNSYDAYWGAAMTAWNSGGAGPDFAGPGGGGLLGTGQTLTTTGGRIYIASVSAVPTNNGTINVTLGLAGGYTNVLYPIYSSTNSALPIAGWSYVGQTNTDCYITITNQSSNSAYYLVEAPLPTNGLQLWLRADGSVGHVGPNVVTWFDETSYGNNFGQNNSPLQPSLVANQINGKPVIRFTAANSMVLTNFNGFLSSASAGETIMLIRAQSAFPTAARGLWSFSTAPQDTYGYPRATGNIADTFGLNGVTNIGFPCQSITDYHTYHVSASSTNWTARINGGIQYTTSGSTFSCGTTTQIGEGGGGGPAYFDGDVVEVLLYNRTLAASERDAAMTYLSQKYALVTNAPATPTNFTVSPVSTNQIALTWNASMGNFKTEFIIERKTGSGGTYAQIGEVDNGQSYFDTGLTANTQYYYRMFAANYYGDSYYSGETNATTYSSSFVTLPVNDLKLWLKADTGVVYNTTNTVQQWLDQTTNGNNASGLSGPAPTWVSNQLNTLPVVHFTNQSMALPNFLSTSVETSVEGFALVRAASTNSNAGLWNFGSSSSGSLGYPRYNGAIEDSFGSTLPMSFGILTNGITVVTNYHIYNISSDSTNLIARINGVPQQTNTGNTVGFPSGGNQVSLGANGNGNSNPFSGDMVEILIFDRVLTSSERTTVTNYLSGKYGL